MSAGAPGEPVIRIRPAAAADLPALAALLVTQLREHGIDLDRAAIERAAHGMLLRPQRGRFLLACDGGTLIGFAALSFLWTLERGGWAAWLDELYIVPERRGHGVGERLLHEAVAVATAAGAAAVDLEIDADHDRAASLYQRNGFERLPRTRWTRPLATRAPVHPAAALPLHGGCYCGAVRYRVAAAPVEVSHCHCGICRRTTGAPFVTWATVPAAAFAFTAGAPAVLRSTPQAERQLCSSCGTALTFRERARPELIDVTAGSLDEPSALRPDEHIWTASQLRWLSLDDDLPRHLERGPSDANER